MNDFNHIHDELTPAEYKKTSQYAQDLFKCSSGFKLGYLDTNLYMFKKTKDFNGDPIIIAYGLAPLDSDIKFIFYQESSHTFGFREDPPFSASIPNTDDLILNSNKALYNLYICKECGERILSQQDMRFINPIYKGALCSDCFNKVIKQSIRNMME